MDHYADRYLHKKFKKQLSIDPRTNNHYIHQQTNSVPTDSTNRNEASVNVSSAQNHDTSSISAVVNSELDSNRNFDDKQSLDDISDANETAEPSVASSTTTTSSIYKYMSTSSVDSRLECAGVDENVDQQQQQQEKQNAQPDKAATGGKYVCTYCNLACSKPSVLQKHIRAHTNERPYPCVSCGFSFKTRSNLYKHCRSRTHANRVMGNKAQEISCENEGTDSLSKTDSPQPENSSDLPLIDDKEEDLSNQIVQDVKAKPYKPRFHTAKNFSFNENVENSPQNADSSKNNSEIISLHIKELIDKNNSIVNTSEGFYPQHLSDSPEPQPQRTISEEPLNLTNKNRKRCLSEVATEPVTQKSLIKELLLKNLYADSNMQCPHCKMIFQTFTELELHKIRSCKGFTKGGLKYSRSSSVNVASILTQNKNAFDNIPQFQNSGVFPLKSPGPFLGKTRLVESDKMKSFSFEDGIQQFTANDLLNKTVYPLSPLTLSGDRTKKPNVKLFGGEVKITQSTGETKSFKIDGKEREKYNTESYVEFGAKVSENRVVKSTLQSGGTVLQNKPSYDKQDSLRSSPEVICVYENRLVSPSVDLDKSRFTFDNRFGVEQQYIHDDRGPRIPNGIAAGKTAPSPGYNKYTNIMDFSQNAAKMLAPNLKQLNITIPGVVVPMKQQQQHQHVDAVLTVSNHLQNKPKSVIHDMKIDVRPQDNNYMHKQTLSPILCAHFNRLNSTEIIVKHDADTRKKEYQQKLQHPSVQNGKILNPINLLVGDKVVRHVPGIPGPVVAEPPPPLPPMDTGPKQRLAKPSIMITSWSDAKKEISRTEALEIKTEVPSPKPSSINKSPTPETPRKFARPNSLALKPSMSSLKQHHGLTPTMNNQILISPETPRCAKKYNEHILHGNYFSYLGLKSSTKPVYCTLNKTQPFYVPHFKKLSMYSEWRQQDKDKDKLYVSGYDSRQRSAKYTVAGKTTDDIVHSSYKFTVSDALLGKDENSKGNSILGGYESNEDYTYVRGRGRGRYVCDQCGIRCKKPSMLKKHIRTHSNDRPYTCSHCNFSFKTKGNLTKHMKSKAHTKNYAASSTSSPSAHRSNSPSSDSDTEDSGMDSSDESSTRLQEHEAACGLLSLSQKPSTSANLNNDTGSQSSPSLSPVSTVSGTEPPPTPSSFMNPEQLVHVSKASYAKNKILDQQVTDSKFVYIVNSTPTSISASDDGDALSLYLGKCSVSRPLTYPYTSINPHEIGDRLDPEVSDVDKSSAKNIIHFNVIKRYNKEIPSNNLYKSGRTKADEPPPISQEEYKEKIFHPPPSTSNANEFGPFRKRKLYLYPPEEPPQVGFKQTKGESEVMDLSMAPVAMVNTNNGALFEGDGSKKYYENVASNRYDQKQNEENYIPVLIEFKNSMNVPAEKHDRIIKYGVTDSPTILPEQPVTRATVEYDNSAMETLADIATKQQKLEKNSVAKNVASEFLKLATKNEYPNGLDGNGGGFLKSSKEYNELVGKPEENKSCNICSKSFNKPSQLRLHMNVHYIERPFKCESCSVSFRTKGHLQKHERSLGHHTKLSSSPALSSSEPRPFKCSDCKIAFRIHGHLAKHLRSKMHIMKLECLRKIPFGLYAELERSNNLLMEINTADGEQCLDSLKLLAKKVFLNDPSKLDQLGDHQMDHNSDEIDLES